MKEEGARVISVRAVRGIGRKNEGIEVREDELVTITAQQLFKLRCECGRSWFELQLPQLVRCPACKQLGAVTT